MRAIFFIHNVHEGKQRYAMELDQNHTKSTETEVRISSSIYQKLNLLLFQYQDDSRSLGSSKCIQKTWKAKKKT